MASLALKKQARIKRKKRVRKKISGTKEKPRLTIFRTSKHIYAQIVDDIAGHTLAAASSMEKVIRDHEKFDNKVESASFVGERVGERAIKKGLKKIVFDRNGFLYHGRVKALSDGARKAGLDF